MSNSSGYRMDALDQLSDDELRLQLVQFGFPNMPVTGTTRNILIKKLRHHLEEEKRKVRRESSQAARYSSGEESDGSDGRKLGGSSSARKTFGRSSRVTSMAAPPSPAAGNSMKRGLKNSISSSTSSSAAAVAAAQHSLSNHGNSPFLAANGGGNSSGGAKKGSLSPSSIYISPVIVHEGDEDDFASSTLRNPPRAFGSTSSPSYQSSLFRKTALAAQNVTPPTMAANNSDSNGSNGSGSGGDSSPPYVSDYTKRLMQLRGETVSQENYNSAIGGIIGRRSSNTLGAGGGGVVGIGSSRYTIGPPSASNSSSHLLHHPSRVPVHPLHYRSSTGNNSSNTGNNTTGTFKPLGGMPSALVSGNHIRQRYSRLMHGGQAAEVDENDIVTHAQPSPEPPPTGMMASGVPLRVAFGNLLTRLDEHYGFKQTFVPCALLCLLIAFLVSVALMYMTISTDLASTLSSIDTRYDVCENESEIGIGENHAPPESGTTCVDEADVKPALELLKLIGGELKQRVEAYHCRRGDVDGTGVVSKLPLAASLMSPADVLKKAKEDSPSVLIPQLTRHLHTLEYLIDRNPQWRIDHSDADGQPLTFAEVLERRPTKTHYFTILRPKLPFGCMLYNKFQKFFTIVGGLALAAVLGFLARYFYRFVVYVKQKRRDQVNTLISEIIHAVSQAAANAAEATSMANGGSGTVPIPDARVVVAHLRDRLIPIENRRKMGWAWNEALQFLEHNESRISFEIGTVGGEDFKMMRWIDTAPLPSSIGGNNSLANTPGGRAGGTVGAGGGSSGGGTVAPGLGSSSKKWQGQAFDSSNKIHDPPTPCLKIRQMFDRYEVNDPNLKTIVQDAILEKVGDRCRIYDIQLDRGSCCVYVRCATPKDAGIVHDEINGWWFDNRLVSIKFLRLERYQQRFPRSLAGPACLKPSNKSNSSMSHQLGGSTNGGRSGSVSRSVHEDDESEPEEEEEEEMAEELVVMPAARSGTPTREDFLRQLKQRQQSTNNTPTQNALRRIPAPRLDDLDEQDD
ncbi:inner nuclear membrane protein Man1 [Anopheles darlingi]|uniref:inner nuclear membrane protein Man1 n=1 Tax=Anopheles darlingi TaxID=43151 RepID=UPI0021000D6A|nr:inner nuclear membrane protein Man1 [Anopheles darlingi]